MPAQLLESESPQGAPLLAALLRHDRKPARTRFELQAGHPAHGPHAGGVGHGSGVTLLHPIPARTLTALVHPGFPKGIDSIGLRPSIFRRPLFWSRLAPYWIATRAALFLAAIAFDSMWMLDFARRLSGSARRSLLQLVGLFLIFELDEVGYVKERVALKPQIDKRRLHARQYARNASVVDGTRKGVFVFAFVVDFRELIVFQNRKPRLMRRA